jgi:hypothetical protein
MNKFSDVLAGLLGKRPASWLSVAGLTIFPSDL